MFVEDYFKFRKLENTAESVGLKINLCILATGEGAKMYIFVIADQAVKIPKYVDYLRTENDNRWHCYSLAEVEAFLHGFIRGKKAR